MKPRQPAFSRTIPALQSAPPGGRLAAVVGILALLALGACVRQQHPIERQLSQLAGQRPDGVAMLAGSDWPAGTLLCPLSPYQSALPAATPATPAVLRVNAYLKRTQFAGDEDHWSLVVVKPAPAGDEGIEQLIFRRGDYDVVNEEKRVEAAARTQAQAFRLQTCVPVEDARVLVTRDRSQRAHISFGTSSGG